MKLLATTAALALLAAAPAGAVTILTFGQVGGANTISGSSNLAGTTFGGTDVPVLITQIDAGLSTPFAAYLDLSAISTPAGATVGGGGAVVEHFTGAFSVNADAANTGTNYLSGTFSDGAITAVGATAIAVFAPTTTFASDVIADLGLPRSLTFGLTNVTPEVSLVSAPLTGSGQTLAGFTASVAGNASAEAAAVPEPASLGLLGLGLVGLGLLRRRRAA